MFILMVSQLHRWQMFLSPWALPPEAQQMMQLSIENGYKRFITLVADARHSTPEQIDKIARATSGPAGMQKLTGWSIVSGFR